MTDTAPTAAFRQHHDVEPPRVDDRHFRPAWRVLTRLDGLLSDRAITSGEWHAAADYRELIDMIACVALIRSPLGRAVLGAPVRHFAPSLAGELDALDRLEQIRARLGAWACGLLDLVIISDLSWAALGRHYRCDPKTARTWAIAAIKALRTV